MLKRRGFLLGLTGIICAPAIIRASSLMAVKPWLDDGIAMWSISHPPSASMVPYDLNPDSMVEFTIDNLRVKATERFSYWGVRRETTSAFYGSFMGENNA